MTAAVATVAVIVLTSMAIGLLIANRLAAYQQRRLEAWFAQMLAPRAPWAYDPRTVPGWHPERGLAGPEDDTAQTPAGWGR